MNAEAGGVVLEFNPGPGHGVLRVKILETVQDQRVRWEFISTHPANSPASAWTGTQVLFEISRRLVPPWATERTSMAILDFRHSGWDETSEYLGFCNFAWAEALLKLKQWCEAAYPSIACMAMGPGVERRVRWTSRQSGGRAG